MSWGCCFFLYGWVRVCFTWCAGVYGEWLGLPGGACVSRGVCVRLGVGLSELGAGGLDRVARGIENV